MRLLGRTTLWGHCEEPCCEVIVTALWRHRGGPSCEVIRYVGLPYEIIGQDHFVRSLWSHLAGPHFEVIMWLVPCLMGAKNKIGRLAGNPPWRNMRKRLCLRWQQQLSQGSAPLALRTRRTDPGEIWKLQLFNSCKHGAIYDTLAVTDPTIFVKTSNLYPLRWNNCIGKNLIKICAVDSYVINVCITNGAVTMVVCVVPYGTRHHWENLFLGVKRCQIWSILKLVLGINNANLFGRH